MKKTIFKKLIQDDIIEQINELCKKAGLHDLHLYHTGYESDSEKVLFFAKSVDKGTHLFLLVDKASAIADILGVDSEQIMLTPLDRIASEFRESREESAQRYAKDNKTNLRQWYGQSESSEEVLPSSPQPAKSTPKKPVSNDFWADKQRKRKNKNSLEETNKRSKKSTELNGMSSDVVECLKKEGLWEKLLTNPHVLLEVQSTLAQEKSTSSTPIPASE